MYFLHKLQVLQSELLLEDVGYLIEELPNIKEAIYELNLTVVELRQILNIFNHTKQKLKRTINSSHISLKLWVLEFQNTFENLNRPTDAV